MFEELDIWKLLAGLGIFMFGMFLLEESIRNLSGKTFKTFIRKYTSGRLKAIGSGVLVTSILQSSSAVSLMLLAFVGAGIMSMSNAIGVILGSNIGTTMTSWIVASVGFKLSIEAFALPLIGSGGLGLIFLSKSERYSNISKLLVGFGFLFMGLDYMKVSVEAFATHMDLATMMTNPAMYLLIGLALTAIMQSSSATMAIILTGLHAQIMSFDSAALMVIGANVGTTVTVLLGAIGSTQIKKRVAFSHLLFNVFTAVVALLLLPFLTWAVLQSFDINTDAVMALALFHTLFNLVGVLLFLPFTGFMSKILIKLVPDRKKTTTLYLDTHSIDIAEAALNPIGKESIHLISQVMHHNMKILELEESLVFVKQGKKEQNWNSLKEHYNGIKLIQAEILTFSTKINSKELSNEQAIELTRLLHAGRLALHSAKTLRDVQHYFTEFDQSDIPFLNQQYQNFRRRLIEAYLSLSKVINNDKSNLPKALIKIFKTITQEDLQFVKHTTKQAGKGRLEEIDLSNAIILNRAFNQSCKQLINAVKEASLSAEELALFDQMTEQAKVPKAKLS